jgi:hypothetical protein
VTCIAAYLVTVQGYASSQITILCTYVGQLQMVRKMLLEQGIAGCLATTVDNYQGEETDFVLLSLVRSNAENTTGFLNVSNRVVVALSRARLGFYCVGNMSMLAQVGGVRSYIVWFGHARAGLCVISTHKRSRHQTPHTLTAPADTALHLASLISRRRRRACGRQCSRCFWAGCRSRATRPAAPSTASAATRAHRWARRCRCARKTGPAWSGESAL